MPNANSLEVGRSFWLRTALTVKLFASVATSLLMNRCRPLVPATSLSTAEEIRFAAVARSRMLGLKFEVIVDGQLSLHFL